MGFLRKERRFAFGNPHGEAWGVDIKGRDVVEGGRRDLGGNGVVGRGVNGVVGMKHEGARDYENTKAPVLLKEGKKGHTKFVWEMGVFA